MSDGPDDESLSAFPSIPAHCCADLERNTRAAGIELPTHPRSVATVTREPGVALVFAMLARPNEPANDRIDHPPSERGRFLQTPDGHLFELMASPSGAT